MTRPRIGELFAGYGGLGMGVKAVLGCDIAWVSEIDKGACKVLDHRFPDVPNHGDITAIKWVPDCPTELGGCGRPADVLADKSGWQCHRCQMLWPISLGKVYWPEVPEPVDILTGGFPCQDVSSAGKRAGIRPGTRSGLWNHFAYAIDQLRPRLVVIENVRGLLSAEAHSDVEPCPWCVGDDTDGALRALGAVLGDLADLGYDASWYGVRAADVGAPHGRFRVFVTAWPTSDAKRGGWVGRTHELRGSSVHPAGNGEGSLPPTPRVGGMGDNPSERRRHTPGLEVAVNLLPTPAVNDMGEGKTVEAWDDWTAKMKSAHGNGNGHGASLAIEAQRLLPTPQANDPASRSEESAAIREEAFHGTIDLITAVNRQWGDYAAAIYRWEQTLGRPAPAPTQTSSKGNPQLAPAFVEWMMGLPAGWVTDVPGITRNEALKLCGNGVCPAQAEAAIRILLSRTEMAA